MNTKGATMFGERISILMAGKDIPQTAQERVLMYAYHSALDGQGLLKTYLNSRETLLLEDNLDAFMLGYSSGCKVLKFNLTTQENITNKSLN